MVSSGSTATAIVLGRRRARAAAFAAASGFADLADARAFDRSGLGGATTGAAGLGVADLGATGLGAADLGAAGLGAADLGAVGFGVARLDPAVVAGGRFGLGAAMAAGLYPNAASDDVDDGRDDGPVGRTNDPP